MASAAGSFSDKNAGADKTVNISTLSLDGADAGNYTLADPNATAAADIVPGFVTPLFPEQVERAKTVGVSGPAQLLLDW